MKLSARRAEMLSVMALLLQVFFFLLTYFLGGWTNSTAVGIEAWHFLGGVPIWLILFLQFRQRRLSEEERLDAEQYERLRQEGKDTSVFEGTAAEGGLHIAERRLRWLEKYLVGVFALLTAGYLIGMGIYYYRVVQRLPERPELAGHDTILRASGLLIAFSMVCFLFSRYAVGMSRQAVWRPLRAGGSYLLSNSLACLALAVLLLFADAGYLRVEYYAAYVLTILLGLIGVEIILNLILDAYQPRIKGRYRRAAYESRLLGLFSEPGGILRTAAHAMDYQFGFKVSETWFYKLLERAVFPLLGLQALILYFMTCLAIVEPGNVGVLERFGEPLNKDAPWESGLHWKLPWPVDVVRQFPVKQLQSLEVGFERDAEHTGKPILWTEKHWKAEFPFIVAAKVGRADAAKSAESAGEGEALARNDFDLLTIGLAVQYRIVDVAKYGYGSREKPSYLDPAKLLESLCYQEVIHYTAQSSMEELMGPGRQGTTEELKQCFQERADAYGLGVKIVYVGLESLHPPVEVAKSFEDVVSALQNKQAKVLTATGEAREKLYGAEARSRVSASEADAYAFERAELAKAGAELFGRKRQAYEAGGEVYLWREYLSMLEETLPGMRKYVLASPAVKRWVYELDLKESVQPDLFEGLGLEEKKQESAK